jgi:endonuclease-3
MPDKQPTSFDIHRAMQIVRQAVRPYPPAAMFALYDEGYTAPFEQLVACMISIRTRDETMIAIARDLFQKARTPQAMSELSAAEIDDFIGACAFHERKAHQIHDIATTLVQEHGGRLPCDEELLLSFRGVGPKCANLVLGIACERDLIGVDVHVHRITNRWGYVQTERPRQTMTALMEKLPRRYWVEINRLLVPFGKHICTGHRPRCSHCPMLEMCAQVGVERPR